MTKTKEEWLLFLAGEKLNKNRVSMIAEICLLQRPDADDMVTLKQIILETNNDGLSYMASSIMVLTKHFPNLADLAKKDLIDRDFDEIHELLSWQTRKNIYIIRDPSSRSEIEKMERRWSGPRRQKK